MADAVKILDFLNSQGWPKDWDNSGFASESLQKKITEAVQRAVSSIIDRIGKGEAHFKPEDAFIYGYISGEEKLVTVQVYSDASETHSKSSDLWSSALFKLEIPTEADNVQVASTRLYVGNENIQMADDYEETLSYFNSSEEFKIPKSGFNKIPISQLIDMEPTAKLILSLWYKVDEEKQEKFLDVGRWMFNRMASLLRYAAGPNSPNLFDQKKTYLMFNTKDWYGKYVPRIGIMDMETDKPLFAIIPYTLYDPVCPMNSTVASSRTGFAKPEITGGWQKVRAYFGWKAAINEND